MAFLTWFAAIAIGPVLLLAVIGWAFWRNRTAPRRRQEDRADRGARRLREEIDRDPAYRD